MVIIQVLVGTVCGGFITLMTTRYKERGRLEKELQELKATIKGVDKNIRQEISEIKKAQAVELRYSIRHTCQDFLDRGYISADQLDHLDELMQNYALYESIVAESGLRNGFVDSLVNSVRNLPHEAVENKS